MVFERSRGQNYFLTLDNRKYFISETGIDYLRQLAEDEGIELDAFLDDFYFLPGYIFDGNDLPCGRGALIEVCGKDGYDVIGYANVGES